MRCWLWLASCAVLHIAAAQKADGRIQVATLRPGAVTENATVEVCLNQFSGQIISEQTYAQRPVGQRIRGLFKPVHTGAVFGWPSNC